MLMYPLGAQSVKCSMCHNVTQVNPAAAPGATSQPMQPAGAPVPAPQQQQQQQQQQQRPPTQTVVVENPPTLNEQGAEVRRVAPACQHCSKPAVSNRTSTLAVCSGSSISSWPHALCFPAITGVPTRPHIDGAMVLV
jgi:LSD1 subclass zinc finger protein